MSVSMQNAIIYLTTGLQIGGGKGYFSIDYLEISIEN